MEIELSRENKTVGLRESLKALKDGKVIKAYVAKDVQPELIKEFMDMCEKHLIQIEYVDSKTQLGEICGIERSATVACILKK